MTETQSKLKLSHVDHSKKHWDSNYYIIKLWINIGVRVPPGVLADSFAHVTPYWSTMLLILGFGAYWRQTYLSIFITVSWMWLTTV